MKIIIPGRIIWQRWEEALPGSDRICGSTYLRGIDFIQIPTTLLAQVDSSVGGKTGVDFDQYKNMVGAFHQPRLVYMNMSTLKTLDDDQFASGMGEVLKSALIRDGR